MKSRKPNKYRGKGRKPDSKRECSRPEERDDRVEERKDDRLTSLNDLSWYAHNPLLLQAAASLPFPYRPGMLLSLGSGILPNGASTATPTEMKAGLPGVAALPWVPSIGLSQNVTDPASIAAKEIFAKVREKFSGSIEADPPDFIIYLLALDSAFSAIGALKRIYRILSVYSPDNYLVPDTLLYALGINEGVIPTWKENRMQLFQYINELVGMTQKFACPDVMDLLRRHYWMNDNVYLDAPTPNAQMYVFREEAFYKYTLLADPQGQLAGGLSGVTINYASPLTAYQSVRDMINALASSDDAYIISGYLMRAYEGAPVFRVDNIMLDERFSPVYVEEVLQQIENSAGPGYGLDCAIQPITQDPKTNTLLHTPKTSLSIDLSANEISAAHYAMDKKFNIAPWISVRSLTPTVGEVTIATRLKCAVTGFFTEDAGGETGYGATIICGTEAPGEWEVYFPVVAGGNRRITREDLPSIGFEDPDKLTKMSKGSLVKLQDFGNMSQFDWMPMSLVVTLSATTMRPTFLGDTHNLTSVTTEQLQNLHRVCIYSEFNAFSMN